MFYLKLFLLLVLSFAVVHLLQVSSCMQYRPKLAANFCINIIRCNTTKKSIVDYQPNNITHFQLPLVPLGLTAVVSPANNQRGYHKTNGFSAIRRFHEAIPSLLKGTSPIHETTSPLPGVTSPIHETTSPIHETTSPLLGATSPLLEATSPIHGLILRLFQAIPCITRATSAIKFLTSALLYITIIRNHQGVQRISIHL